MELIENADRVASLTGGAVFYKRWLSSSRLLLLTLVPESADYCMSVFECTSQKNEALNIPSGLQPIARIVPMRCFNTRGELMDEDRFLLWPQVYVSPDRLHACWLNTNYEWSFCNLPELAVTQQQCSGSPIPEECGAWVSNTVFVVPVSTRSSKWIRGVNSYHIGEPNASFTRTSRFRNGTVMGASSGGNVYVESRRATEKVITKTVHKLSVMNLETGIVSICADALPLTNDLRVDQIALCPVTSRIARILSSDDGTRKTYRLCVSDGRTVTLDADLGDLPSPSSKEIMLGGYGIYDLEWAPDGSGITYIYMKDVYKFAI